MAPWHGAGDQLLITVGRRLQQAVRPGDTVARIGGDEFVVCCPGVHDVAQAFIVAERVLGVLRSPVELAPGTVALGVGGGIALSTAGESARSLLRRSDTAMYAAKDRGRGRVEVFTDELRARSTRHLRIRSDLDGAVGRDESVCHHQPLIDLRTGAIVGVEALVRWRHRTRGLLLREEWLDVAEGHAAIVSIGGHVPREACRWAAARPETATPLTVHVNISGRQLADSGTVDQVFSALDASGLDPARLVLELTETHLLEAHPSLVRDLHTLRDRGVHLAADDFGTGFSSLSHLLALPVDQVKVDRSFVATALHDPRSAAIVRGLLVLAEGMELGVVAEGVESMEQARYLRELGCETGQGCLWSGAVPGDPWPSDDGADRRAWADGDDPRLGEQPVPRSTDPGASAPTVRRLR